jgi:hypothetical protein
MHGNVWEWVQDTHHDDYNGAPTDGSAWAGSDACWIARGGGWNSGAGRCRSANRTVDDHRNRFRSLGFRLHKLSSSPCQKRAIYGWCARQCVDDDQTTILRRYVCVCRTNINQPAVSGRMNGEFRRRRWVFGNVDNHARSQRRIFLLSVLRAGYPYRTYFSFTMTTRSRYITTAMMHAAKPACTREWYSYVKSVEIASKAEK